MPAARPSKQPFSKIIVFGDSLSDNGNRVSLNYATRIWYWFYRCLYRGLCGNPTNAFKGGRQSNGRVGVEEIARKFNAKVEPAWSVPKGTNYAVSGALVVGTGKIPSLERQIEKFLENYGCDKDVPSDALYIVYIGGNDVLRASKRSVKQGEQHIARAVEGIKKAIYRLAEKGAKRFLVPNQGDNGNTPKMLRIWRRARTGRAATRLSLHFNCLLAPVLDSLEPDLDSLEPPPFEIRIARVDSIGIGICLRANAGKFGWTNLSESCLWKLCNCKFEEYFFFDGLHPTAKRHKLNGEFLCEAIRSNLL